MDSASEQPAECVAIDEQPNHQIVHPFCFAKADRTAHQTLDEATYHQNVALAT